MLQKHQSRPLWARELKHLDKEIYEGGSLRRAPCGRVN